jgi:hypothetical protein
MGALSLAPSVAHGEPQKGIPSAPPAIYVRDDPAIATQVRLQVAALPLTSAEKALVVSQAENLTISQVESFLQPMFSINWNAVAGFVGTAVTGCLLGAAVGAAGAGVGAGVGCVAGAAAAAGAYAIGYEIGKDSQAAQKDLFPGWALAMMAAFGNEENATATAYLNLLSALQFAELGFQRMADHAALLQLNRSSYSVPLDLMQSGLTAQMGAIAWAYNEQVAQPIGPLKSWFDAQGSSGGSYAGSDPLMVANPGPFNGYDAGAAGGLTAHIAGPTVLDGANGGAVYYDLYIPGGQYLTVTGASGTTMTWVAQSYVNPRDWWNGTAQIQSGGVGTLAVPQTAGVYNVTISSSTGNQVIVYLGTGSRIPYSLTSAIGHDGVLSEFSGQTTQPPTCGGSGPSNWNWMDGSTLAMDEYQSCTSKVPETPIYSVYNGGPGNGGLMAYMGSLEWQAAENGNAYWSFLRTLGYTSLSQIPTDCIVPAPYQVLPSALNMSSLNSSQIESLYEVWLEGLGKFYNTSLSGADFCSNAPNGPFNLQNVTWGNWAEQAIGYLYVSNGSGPHSWNGTALPTEKFGNVSTWAIVSTRMVLMPTLAAINVPVGVKWAVPSTNPVWVYVYDTAGYCGPTNYTAACQQTAALLALSGNGTGTGACVKGQLICTQVSPLALAPGDSIYLTSCTLNGLSASNCTVGPQNITVVVQNITCPGGGSSCQQQNQSGGSFFNWGDPFGALACLLAELFGGCGSPLGGLLGSLLTTIIFIAVIGGGLYIAVVELEGWGNRKSRGDSGGATGGA